MRYVPLPRRGQSTVEYMVVIAVLVLAIVVASYTLGFTFRSATRVLQAKACGAYTNGEMLMPGESYSGCTGGS